MRIERDASANELQTSRVHFIKRGDIVFDQYRNAMERAEHVRFAFPKSWRFIPAYCTVGTLTVELGSNCQSIGIDLGNGMKRSIDLKYPGNICLAMCEH